MAESVRKARGAELSGEVIAESPAAYRGKHPGTRRMDRYDTALALGFLTCLGLAGCGTRMAPDVEAPVSDPSNRWARLLDRVNTPEGVDYALIAEERDTLDSYVAWIGEHGPEMDTMRESREDKRLAFLINAYNAAVIYGVLENLPIDSVRDVQLGPLSWRGLGFFGGLRFKVDGDWQSLYVLENQAILGRYQEPLVHVALNCSAASCPPLRWWSPVKLQDNLERATRDWLAGDAMVAEGDGFLVSEIFSWYADDFVYWSHADTVCEWMSTYAEGPRKDWLDANAETCELRTFPYDWTLNQLPASREAGDAPQDQRSEP